MLSCIDGHNMHANTTVFITGKKMINILLDNEGGLVVKKVIATKQEFVVKIISKRMDTHKVILVQNLGNLVGQINVKMDIKFHSKL